MVKGVLLYNRGVKCLVRLAVCIYSLRKHYKGPIALAAEGEVQVWIKEFLEARDVTIFPIETEATHHLGVKSGLWKATPFDITVFLDSDTLIRKPIDRLFDLGEKHGCVVTQQHEWVTTGRIMSGRVRQWSTIAKQETVLALSKKWPAINTGVQVWKKGCPTLPAYEQMTRRAIGVREIMRKTLDEIAMQLVITNNPHHVIGAEWNMGCQYGDGSNAAIIHYHGYKHCRNNANGDLWKKEFFELAKEMPILVTKLGDNCVDKWLSQTFKKRDDLTIVTAVSPSYADRAKRNIALWRQMPGLREQQFVIFVAGFKNSSERKFLEGPNTKVIRWDYPFECSERERMLAAFVLGVPKHVQTSHWVKLDCDCRPVAASIEWPDYRDCAVVSHAWGYTKIKGDRPKEHWFNRFEDVFDVPKDQRMPKLDPVKDRRISHLPGNALGIQKRFASFCHIERTDFTRRIADVAMKRCAGRMPIPSQDTLSWLATQFWKEKVKLVNMKLWFSPR